MGWLNLGFIYFRRPETYISCNASEEVENDYQDYLQNVDKLLIKFLKKEGIIMDEKEIKYTILADDGDNIEFEKAIVEHKSSSRTQIVAYKERIEAIKIHIAEENEEIAKLEEEIAELEKVVEIADEKKASEVEVSVEESQA